MLSEVRFPLSIMKKTILSLFALSVSIAQADEAKNAPATPASPAPATAAPATPASDTKAATSTTAPAAGDAVKPGEAAGEQPKTAEGQEEKGEELQPEQRKGDEKAQDATLRLREKLAEMQAEMAKITKPTRSLINQTNSVKNRITRQLDDMDRRALEIAKLQEEFNKAGAADFTFDKISSDERDQYVRDGQAAYKAMRVDMKQKKGSRKVGGLDKFEIMHARYQGIPEYKDAHERYLSTLRKLEKKWNSMYAKESAARKRYGAAKAKAANELDQRQYNELAAKLKEDGDEITDVWIIPNTRNLKMLDYCARKVKDVLRRTEKEELDEAVGTVPSLLSQYWEAMDNVRLSMINGDLEGADKQLRSIAAYNIIMGLKKELLPQEYRVPIREQYRETQQEITKRMRDYARLKISLERATSALDRITTSAEAQIDSAMEAVQKALDSDIGENTMQVDQPKPEQPAAKPTGEQPAQPQGEQPAAEQAAPAEQPAQPASEQPQAQ